MRKSQLHTITLIFFLIFFTETSKPKLVFNYLKIENEYKAYLIIH